MNELVNNLPNPARLQPKYAGFWMRMWAFLIDMFVISAVSGIIVKPIFRVLGMEIAKPSAFLFTPYKAAALILLLLYFILMTKFGGQTIGKMIIGIRTVKLNGSAMDWSTVIFREGFGRFISQMLWIPYLFVLFLPHKMALHDVFADTAVIHERQYVELPETSLQKQQQLHEDPAI